MFASPLGFSSASPLIEHVVLHRDFQALQVRSSEVFQVDVYLLLYPKPVMERALGSNPELARRVWEFLDTLPPATLLGEGRVYGGGLYKMEPKDLANVPADAIAALLSTPEDRPPLQGEMFKEQAVET